MSVWVSRSQVIRRLRDANWEFSSQTKRVEIYKLRGSPDRIDVPKKDKFPDSFVRIVLRQAGLSKEQIEEFLRTCIKAD